MVLIKRRPDLAVEEFCAYYEQRHAHLAARIIPTDVGAAIKYYQQNHAVRLGSGTTEPAYDCVTEFTFEDRAGLELWAKWYAGEGGRILREDEENFMDISKRVIIITDERPASIHSAC
ncbi:EthD domain-containing protein [Nocardia sp. XZ_19_231]|uniref:EthD domain-containing protein n=1 Tax=Nocardia sp. XZ_19_231 TaxID=2769252 RepID=UPI001E4EC095|nr:EthD domain-containing protein [Nocardia sp. XZ_19_231]